MCRYEGSRVAKVDSTRRDRSGTAPMADYL